ncbi:MAG: dodecin domain-containing protein [Alphaproteobacteria bacterium]|nr:dodecin domain-containing protein [Alphaproteobacteria bacterium]
MSDNVYSVTEIVGTSTKSVEDAIAGAIATAVKTLKHLAWFEIVQTRGHTEDGKVAHYQVVMKIGFLYDSAAA